MLLIVEYAPLLMSSKRTMNLHENSTRIILKSLKKHVKDDFVVVMEILTTVVVVGEGVGAVKVVVVVRFTAFSAHFQNEIGPTPQKITPTTV